MAILIGNIDGINGAMKEYPVANGVTVTSGDFCYLSGGRVTSASPDGVTLLGLVMGGQSNNLGGTVAAALTTATGNVAGTVKVLVAIDPENKYVVTNDNIGTTFATTHVGYAFDVTGATGAQLVDTSTASTTTGQLECTDYSYGGDNTKGVFIINEHKYKVNA